MKKSRTVRPTAGVESPTTRVAARRVADGSGSCGAVGIAGPGRRSRRIGPICGPRYAHQADRTASVASTVAGRGLPLVELD